MGIDLRYSPLEWDADIKGIKTGEVDASGKPVYLFFGILVTRDTVRAAVSTKPGVGSVYFSRGEVYVKVADTDATTDWESVTHSAADAG